MRHRLRTPPSGFLLLETMLGVAIFAIGILVLAKSMQNCLDAEMIRRQDILAQKALENRMAEVSAGAITLGTEVASTTLTGRYDGLTLREWRVATTLKDENNNDVTGLHDIHLQVEWQGPRGVQTRELSFYRYDPLTQ